MSDKDGVSSCASDRDAALSAVSSTYIRAYRDARALLGPQILPDEVLTAHGMRTNDEIAKKIATDAMNDEVARQRAARKK